MASWKGKSRGHILGYKIFVTLLKYTGLTPAYFILRFVAFYFFLFSPNSFRNVFHLYRYKLKLGFFRSLLNVYRNYFLFGQVLLDKIAIMSGFHAKFTFDFEGENYLREMVEQNTGCLLISAHLGNFEMAGQMLERIGARVSIIMVDAEHRQIKNYLSSITQKSFQVIAIREDNSHVFEIKRALENKEVLCMHGDRFVKGSKSMKCEFLGHQASFPSGPFYLSMKYGIPISFVFAMKERRSHYHFYATRPHFYPQQASPAKRDEMLKTILGDYIHEMEHKLRQYPIQWFNYYDFWAE